MYNKDSIHNQSKSLKTIAPSPLYACIFHHIHAERPTAAEVHGSAAPLERRADLHTTQAGLRMPVRGVQLVQFAVDRRGGAVQSGIAAITASPGSNPSSTTSAISSGVRRPMQLCLNRALLLCEAVGRKAMQIDDTITTLATVWLEPHIWMDI